MIGSTISRYTVLEKLGAGGMGVVYKAQDLVLGRHVALKFIGSDLGDAQQRFLQEAKITSALDHPNICTIYGLEKTPEGVYYIVMAYYEGETLAEKIAAGPLPVQSALHFAIQLGDGLYQAHRQGIVHRDIKPRNVLVTREQLLKILDFGVALLGDQTRATVNGVAGTLAYMAPEQLYGANADARSDIWAVGLVLHEMLTAGLPSRDHHGSFHIDPSLPAPVRAVLSRALQSDPARRYQSCGDLVTDLRNFSQSTASGYQSGFFHPAARSAIASIAVMPFVNVTRSAEDEYFSDGLTDELITSLAQIESLRVVSRTSVFQFKDKHFDIRDLAEKLNVEVVVEGSVRRAGDRIRVSAQLTDAREGHMIWSERYDRAGNDIFAIQDETSTAIVTTLRTHLHLEAKAPVPLPRPAHVEAYHLFLKGRFYWFKQTPDSLLKARDFYEQALTHDPNYAPAHAGIADCLAALGFWGVLPPEEVWPLARATAMRALALDSSNASVHNSMGLVSIFCDWDWRRAGEEFRTAVRLTPGDPHTHIFYGMFLIQIGQCRQAVTELRKALDLDPLSLSVHTVLSFAHYYGRDYKSAIRQAQQGLQIDPACTDLRQCLALALAEEHEFEEAIRIMDSLAEAAQGNPLLTGLYGYVLGLAGERERAIQLRDKYSEQLSHMAVAQVIIAAGLGEIESAFEWLNRAVEKREALLCYINVMPCYDRLRNDPRFAAARAKMGFGDSSPAY